MAIVFACVFIFLFSHHKNIISSSTIKLPTKGKSNQKIGKTIFLVLEKATGLVTQTLVTVTKKEVISNSKTTTLTYFDKLQKKQQDQGGKYFYFSFISKLWSNNYSTISNLMWDYLVKNILVQVSSVLKILSFWKKF